MFSNHTHSVWDTRERELGRELDNVLPELRQKLAGLAVTAVGDDKVLKKLVASLLLSLEGDLDSTVEEGGNDLHVLLGHGSGGEGGKTYADTTWYLSRGCERGSSCRRLSYSNSDGW